MALELLRNGGFEADWGEEGSHRCLVSPDGAAQYERNVGNVFTPPGWITWYRHKPGQWDQPEVRDARAANDAARVHSGQKGMVLFTFFRKHDGGFLQPVRAGVGAKLSFSAWAHAWSNSQGRLHTDDARWSEGPGYEAGFLLEGELPPVGSSGSAADWQNFAFSLGIDPTGGMDPFGSRVVWGRSAHIYNQYALVPSVEAVAESDQVTVFLRSKTMWSFKHNDAYWDDVMLSIASRAELRFQPGQPLVGSELRIAATFEASLAGVSLDVRDPAAAPAVTAGPETIAQTETTKTLEWWLIPRRSGEYRVCLLADQGARAVEEITISVQEAAPGPLCVPPRVPYARVYVLLPQDAGVEWVQAVLASGRWERQRWTVGCSADDAGVGPQDRTVIAVNPAKWPGDLEAFFEQYYPGLRYVALGAASADELVPQLRDLVLP